MKKYAVTVPKVVQGLYPKRLWELPNRDQKIYLTFDDGPIPEVTPWVLDLLKEYNAKATFFCIGENIEKHPEIFKRIISEGHSVGNHTYNHLKGWQTETSPYLENVEKCAKVMNSELGDHNSKMLFRPPYGKLTSKQAKMLQNENYQIVMWSLLTFDYDASVTGEVCFKNVSENIKPGSIVVFHDSLKAEKNLRFALPKTLQLLSEKNWKADKIEGLP